MKVIKMWTPDKEENPGFTFTPERLGEAILKAAKKAAKFKQPYVEVFVRQPGDPILTTIQSVYLEKHGARVEIVINLADH